MARSDESALEHLTHTYADAVLAGDPVAWGATWTDDAAWTLAPGRAVTGREAIVELWTKAMSRYTKVVQLYQSATYDVTGDTASGRIYFTELNDTVDGQRKVMIGYYSDTYRRTGDGWKFTSRTLTAFYSGGADLAAPFLPGI
jgi:ketosteroid isomerase-like protein